MDAGMKGFIAVNCIIVIYHKTYVVYVHMVLSLCCPADWRIFCPFSSQTPCGLQQHPCLPAKGNSPEKCRLILTHGEGMWLQCTHFRQYCTFYCFFGHSDSMRLGLSTRMCVHMFLKYALVTVGFVHVICKVCI